jgi:phage baseplate assembly protein W
MSIRGRLLKRLSQRVAGKTLSKQVGRKAMSSAQKAALKKAVKASALARKKAVATYMPRARLLKRSVMETSNVSKTIKKTNARLNAKIAKMSKDSVKRARLQGYVTHNTNLNKQLVRITNKNKSELSKLQSKMSKGFKNPVKIRPTMSPVTQDIIASIGISVAATLAVNPEYTSAKYREAKSAISKKLS